MNGTYAIDQFTDEFTRVFDLETDYDKLSVYEKEEFYSLSEMTARFSNDPNDLKLNNVYLNEGQIRERVKKIINSKP